MRHQFECVGGRDLYFKFKCTCPDELFKDSSIADLMKTDIRLRGYADSNFFDYVNKKPLTISCKCGKKYRVQWFRDGVEYRELKDAEVIK